MQTLEIVVLGLIAFLFGTGTPDDIAAIAAVFVIMDGQPHRILNIAPSTSRSPWVAEGRIAQHGSHTRAR